MLAGSSVDEPQGAAFSWPSIRVLLFDLDDTLWDCRRTLTRARDKFTEKYPQFVVVNQVEEIEKVKQDFPDRSQDFSFLRREFLRRHVDEAAIAKGDAHVSSVLEAQCKYWQRWRNTPVFFEGVVEALREIKNVGDVASDQNRSKGTPSNQQSSDLTVSCRYLIGAITDGNADVSEIPEFAGIFDFVVRAQEVGCAKPDPRMFEAALRYAQEVDKQTIYERHLARSQVIMIGDSFAKDVVGAKQAGFYTCWISAPLGEQQAGPEDLEDIARMCDFVRRRPF